MAEQPGPPRIVAVADTLVTFVDGADVEFPVALPRQGHSNLAVRAVAYRWACKQVADGAWRPHGELRFRSIRADDGRPFL